MKCGFLVVRSAFHFIFHSVLSASLIRFPRLVRAPNDCILDFLVTSRCLLSRSTGFSLVVNTFSNVITKMFTSSEVT